MYTLFMYVPLLPFYILIRLPSDDPGFAHSGMCVYPFEGDDELVRIIMSQSFSLLD